MRLFSSLLAVLMLAGALTISAPPQRSAEAADLRQPVYFDTTGYWLQGSFREYWETHGGLYIFGYPITGIFMDNGLWKQYFERAIFEYHPEYAGTEYEVLLQRLGAIRAEGRENEAAFKPIQTDSDENCTFYAETGHRLCFGFRSYWQDHGGLPNFGFPISEEFDERNQPPPAGDGEIHTVQYFERTRFEYHPEYAGTQYETLLGLLGSEYLVAHPAPADAVARQDPNAPPVDPTSGRAEAAQAAPGFNAFLAGDGSAEATAFNAKTIEMVKAAGFEWVHFQARWDSLEHVGPGLYDPIGLDRITAQTSAAGIKLLVSVVGPSPGWAGVNGDIPTDTAHFRDLMEFLSGRYKGKVQAWEIWNEQNLASNSGGWVQVGPYVELLKAGHDGVRAGDPSAWVLFGALTPNGLDKPDIAIADDLYLQRAYEYTGGALSNYFDALGAHPGSNDNSPDQSWPDNPGTDGWDNDNSFYFRRVEDLRDIMVRWGDSGKRIWLTEFGWSTANEAPGYEYGAAISDEMQANYLLRAFEIGRTEWPWIGPMFVWNLNYSVITDPADEKYPWAVLNGDWSPRPAYDALRTMPKE